MQPHHDFYYLRICSRLALAFGILVLLSGVWAGLSLTLLAGIQQNPEDVVKDNNVKIQLNQEMADPVHVVARVVRTLILLEDRAEMDAEAAKITQARERYDASWSARQKFATSETGRSTRTSPFSKPRTSSTTKPPRPTVPRRAACPSAPASWVR